jgi:O-antigen/teichoic acid export membrane protein
MLKYLRQLASESVIYGITGVLTRFIQIFLVPIYARIFNPEDYGVISLVTSCMAAIAIFVVLSLDLAVYRWFWDTELTEDRKTTYASWAWCQFACSLLFAAIIVCASDWLGLKLLGRSDGGGYFRLAALIIPLSVLDKVCSSWLRLRGRPWGMVGFSAGALLLNVAATVAFVVVWRWGIEGVFAAQVVARVVTTVIAAILLKDWISPLYFRWKRLREMLAFALPLVPATLAFWCINLADRYFLQYYSTTSEIGLYQVGYSIATLVALVTGAFQQAWNPFFLSIHKNERAKEVYGSAFLAYIWVTSVFCTLVSILSPEILRLFTRPAYYGASTVVSFLAFGYAMAGLTDIAGVGPTLAKQTKPIGSAVTYAAVLNLLLNFLLIPRWGKEGAAIATLVAQGTVPVYLFWRAQKVYPIPYPFVSGVFIVAFAGLLTWLASEWQFSPHLWMCFAFKCGLVSLFVPLLFLLRIVTPSQGLRGLRKLKPRRSSAGIL